MSTNHPTPTAAELLSIDGLRIKILRDIHTTNSAGTLAAGTIARVGTHQGAGCFYLDHPSEGRPLEGWARIFNSRDFVLFENFVPLVGPGFEMPREFPYPHGTIITEVDDPESFFVEKKRGMSISGTPCVPGTSTVSWGCYNGDANNGLSLRFDWTRSPEYHNGWTAPAIMSRFAAAVAGYVLPTGLAEPATLASPSPDVPSPDVPSPDVPTPDVPSPDVPSPDVPTPDVPSPDVPPTPPLATLTPELEALIKAHPASRFTRALCRKLHNCVLPEGVTDFTELHQFITDNGKEVEAPLPPATSRPPAQGSYPDWFDEGVVFPVRIITDHRGGWCAQLTGQRDVEVSGYTTWTRTDVEDLECDIPLGELEGLDHYELGEYFSSNCVVTGTSYGEEDHGDSCEENSSTGDATPEDCLDDLAQAVEEMVASYDDED